jgi:hypothetical protein
MNTKIRLLHTQPKYDNIMSFAHTTKKSYRHQKNEDGSDGDGSAPDTGYSSSCIAS